MSRPPEFLQLSDPAVRAVSGPGGRHAALIEDAFKVLLETPGGGVSLAGDARGRGAAKRAVQAIAALADSGAPVADADVRVAIGDARTGEAPAAPGVAEFRAHPRFRPALQALVAPSASIAALRGKLLRYTRTTRRSGTGEAKGT